MEGTAYQSGLWTRGRGVLCPVHNVQLSLWVSDRLDSMALALGLVVCSQQIENPPARAGLLLIFEKLRKVA